MVEIAPSILAANISNLDKGIYILEIQSKETLIRKKLIVK